MPHKEEISEFTPDQYPPFPEGEEFPCVELQTISLQKLVEYDAAEEDRVFEICKGRGFFYLDLAGPESGETIRRGCEQIGHVGAQTMALPMEEKLKYLPKQKQLFGSVVHVTCGNNDILMRWQVQNRWRDQSRCYRRTRYGRIFQREQE